MKDLSKIEYLNITKENLKKLIAERLTIGRGFLTRNISNNSEEKNWWKEFVIWDEYNLELLKQAFEFPNNTYAEKYNRIQPSVGGIYFPGSVRREPSFQERLESTKQEMSSQIWKLERFFEKIELLRTKPQENQKDSVISKIEKLIFLLRRFHKICQELRSRRSERSPLLIRDEYDVQYLLGALLKVYFDDIRVEEFSPSNSGSNSRLDFVLKAENTVVEVKMTKESQSLKQLGEELLVDIGRYKSYPNITNLIIFIYDKLDYIGNKTGFQTDLEKQSTDQVTITVVINPE